MSKRTAVLRGPHVSQSLPIKSLAIIVVATEAIMVLPTCDLVRCRSARMVGINGARPSHPKKQTKNMSDVIYERCAFARPLKKIC
jgi:hypothetical protein